MQSILDLDRNSNSVDITLTVSESSKVYVERINIKGNERTLDKVTIGAGETTKDFVLQGPKPKPKK